MVEQEEKVEVDLSEEKLFKVSELRPLVWSKTVTGFDGYETDEENCEPYRSPLAIYGDAVPSSSTSTDGTDSGSEEGSASVWTQIAEIVQKYYDKPSNGWDSLIRSLKDAKTGDEIGKILSKQKKKKGQENQSYVSVRHEIQSVRNMGY